MEAIKQKFSDFEYKRPDVNAIINNMDKIISDIESAESVDDVKKAFDRYHSVSLEFFNATNICYIRHTIDTNDKFYKDENNFSDKYTPIIKEKCLSVNKALLDSKFHEELEASYGKLLFDKLERDVKSVDKKIVPLMQEENLLCEQFNQICASAQIPFDGKIYTLSEMRPLKASTDRTVRKAAYEAEGKFFESHSEELDEIFDKLVKNRTAQAKALGMKDYSELGFIHMGRIGYTKQDIEYYRKQVIEDLVPAANEIINIQKKRTGIKDWKGYDNALLFPDGNPSPKGTPQELLEASQKMFHAISPETSEFIDEMMECDLFDVLSRKGKADNGYCSYIEKQKCSFIFANFSGTYRDVDVLIHESGHAFAGFMNYRKNTIPEYFMPGAEGCETHSIGMEYLTEEFHNLFFKEDTAKYELMHNERGITAIPSSCLEDEFQYRVYENPDWTPEQRHEEWRRLESIYQPHFSDFDDIPFYGRRARWLSEMHIIVLPFYLIDYALARTVALQLWTIHMKDKKDAWKKYMNFVSGGGSKPFTELVADVNLKSPFDKGCIKDIVTPVMEWIRNHQL